MVNEQALKLGTARSVIRELFEYGNNRAKVVGRENIFDYSLGNPSIPAPKEVNEAICDILANEPPLAVHGYTSAAGDPAVRQAIAEDLNLRFHAGAKAEELFLGCGAAPELTAVLKALAVENSEVLAIAPYFPEYKPFAESAGLTFTVVSSAAPDFRLPVAAIEKQLTANTQAVLINSPNNPSGTVYTKEELTALAAVLTKKSKEFGHPVYIIADEPYRELVYDGVQTPFIPNIYPNTVVCYSYSKALSLPGERIGYIYVPSQAADSAQLYGAIAGAARSMGHVCAPSLLQKVIGRCTHLRPDLGSYDKNRRALYEGLIEAGYKVVKPDGAFYLFVEAPGGDGIAFSEKAKQLDVLVVPGEGFGCPGYFRLCYCVSYDTIMRSLPLFKKLRSE